MDKCPQPNKKPPDFIGGLLLPDLDSNQDKLNQNQFRNRNQRIPKIGARTLVRFLLAQHWVLLRQVKIELKRNEFRAPAMH